MGFEFEDFNIPSVQAVYKPEHFKGEGLKMMVNLNLITLEKMESIEADFKKWFDEFTKNHEPKKENTEEENTSKEQESKLEVFFLEKNQLRFRARMLCGKPGENNPDDRYIESWEMKNKAGEDIPVSYESIIGLSKKAIDDLYTFVTTEAGKPTKKKN